MHSVAAAIREIPNRDPRALSEPHLVELKALDGESGLLSSDLDTNSCVTLASCMTKASSFLVSVSLSEKSLSCPGHRSIRDGCLNHVVNTGWPGAPAAWPQGRGGSVRGVSSVDNHLCSRSAKYTSRSRYSGKSG